MAKTLKTVALLEQPFIKDGDKNVATIVKEAISALGENIQVRRFERCAAWPLEWERKNGVSPLSGHSADTAPFWVFCGHHPAKCCPVHETDGVMAAFPLVLRRHPLLLTELPRCFGKW